MILTNTTDFPDHFLRKMVSWVAKELDIPQRTLQSFAVRNRAAAWCGRYYGHGRFSCRVGPSSSFPDNDTRDGHVVHLTDRVDALVYVTIHELAHHVQWRDGRLRKLGRGLERVTRGSSRGTFKTFVEQRAMLEAEWMTPPPLRVVKKRSVVEQRAISAGKKLAEWEKKLKTAQRLVKKYRAKTRYYELKGVATHGWA